MHIRPKAWARPELDASPFFINQPVHYAGHWQDSFKKEQPLSVELGCGKGGFIATLAHQNPQTNFLAVDLIDAVLGLAKRNIEDAYQNDPIDNCRLTAYDIRSIDQILKPDDAVQSLYINFCNPWPKHRHHKKRLTHPRQLQLYRQFLAPSGQIHFKTDNNALFDDSLIYFKEMGFLIKHEIHDLHAAELPDNIETEHEKMFAAENIKIKYACLTLDPAFNPQSIPTQYALDHSKYLRNQ